VDHFHRDKRSPSGGVHNLDPEATKRSKRDTTKHNTERRSFTKPVVKKQRRVKGRSQQLFQGEMK